MNEELIPKARQYCAARQLEVTKLLGSGKDGIVLTGRHKINPVDVAVKILRHDGCFAQ